ncbi:hypothetical protein B0A49_04576 [Cryomyces minteri]|uniref:C2H2-type domain-containing protein n=1 Tax=Cryomyces minteri TaxID=331657 RepID=A0A4U0XK43_9PEZI|nr:hypothetical protein B0A49_04576 [Cryomyces minteri]
MAMAVDTRQQPQMGGMGYEHLRYPAPQFTNPWASAPAASNPTQLYPTSIPSSHAGVDSLSQQQVSRAAAVSMPYASLPIPATSLEADLMNTTRPYGSEYSSSTSPAPSSYAPTSAPQYAMEYTHNRGPYAYSQDPSRRLSYPSVSSAAFAEVQRQRQNSLIDLSRTMSQQAQRNSFSDALDASRGMVAMSQDITPRNIYGNQGSSRNATDSYGFPATHSSHSSISSASTYPSYYNGSVGGDSSVTDYSSASESIESMTSRTLPRPSALVGANMQQASPPAPQSMMGQFSSKVSSSSQKKHKCKICDKRFTRPSSLQTHMYSHTGEKRK